MKAGCGEGGQRAGGEAGGEGELRARLYLPLQALTSANKPMKLAQTPAPKKALYAAKNKVGFSQKVDRQLFLRGIRRHSL